MQIDQLEVTNFRCFEHLTLDLHPEFNVLIGDNGAGKTTVLEALTIAVAGWIQSLSGFPMPDVRAEDIRLIGRRIGSGTTFEAQNPLHAIARGATGGHKVNWARTLLAQDGDQARRSMNDHLKTLTNELGRAVKDGEAVTLPLVAYYAAGRLCPSDGDQEQEEFLLTPRELSRLEGYRNALNARTSARGLTRWLAYQDYAAYQEKQESPVYRAVLNAMQGMVEGATDVRFDAKRLEIVVEFEGGAVHPLAHLSDGQRNMLALAGDIAMRTARLNPQFDADVLKQTPGVVLIDELDLHLHPRWQRHVAADLRRTFPKIQFVTTTHSPQIIGELRPENIIMLGENERNGLPTQSYGMDTNFILRHAMNTPDREPAVIIRLSSIEALIEGEKYEEAQQQIDALRAEIGEFAELVRLQTRINKVLVLSR
jgi:predicted ATP-binding protein involved in virulence